MDDDMIKHLMGIISNKNLIRISKKVKLEIRGFREVNEKNGKIIPPRNLIINELLGKNYRDLLDKIFDEESKDKIYIEIDKENLNNYLDENKKEKIIIILEKLIHNNIKVNFEGKELNLNNVRDIFEEIHYSESKLESEEFKKNNYNEKLEILNRKIEELQKYILQIENHNKNMIINIKDLKKEKIILQNEVHNLNKVNECKSKESEKYKNDFYNIKKKYDEVKKLNNSQIIELEEKELEIKNLKEINEKINEKLNLFEKKENERKELEMKKVAVFGEINRKDMNQIRNYKLNFINIKKIEEFKKEISEFNEIWLLSYAISYLDIITIQENIAEDRILEFTSYIKLKNYLRGRE